MGMVIVKHVPGFNTPVNESYKILHIQLSKLYTHQSKSYIKLRTLQKQVKEQHTLEVYFGPLRRKKKSKSNEMFVTTVKPVLSSHSTMDNKGLKD